MGQTSGLISVIGLTYLNLLGLPDSIAGFYGDKATAGQIQTAHIIAYVIIALVLALLVWTIVELYLGNKRFKEEQDAKLQESVE